MISIIQSSFNNQIILIKYLKNNMCEICKRIRQIKQGTNKYFVMELKTGYVVLEDNQFFKGYSLFLCKKHVKELHKLPSSYKLTFLTEMSLIGEAIYQTFKPKKLNYELLGNKYPHLHWHIIPRYLDDLYNKKPIWVISKKNRYKKSYKNKRNLTSFIKRLRNQLSKMIY